MTKTSAIGEAKGIVPTKPKRGRKGLQCRNLSNEQRASLLQSLLKHRADATNDGSNGNNSKATSNNNSTKLRKGALLEASKTFGVSTKTCKRIWERFLETADDDLSGGDVSHRKHQSGRPKKISALELEQKILQLPQESRSSVRGLARALGMPHTTIHRRLKSGEIQLESLLTTNKKSKQTDGDAENGDSKENTNEALGNQKMAAKTSKV